LIAAQNNRPIKYAGLQGQPFGHIGGNMAMQKIMLRKIGGRTCAIGGQPLAVKNYWDIRTHGWQYAIGEQKNKNYLAAWANKLS
jgi:hypothetical protein